MTSQGAAAAALESMQQQQQPQQGQVQQQQQPQHQLWLLQGQLPPQNPLTAFVAAALEGTEPPAAAAAATGAATGVAAAAAAEKQPHRAFAVLFHLFTEGRGLPVAALEAASAADAAAAAAAGGKGGNDSSSISSISISSRICLLRGDNVRQLMAQHLRQLSGELGGIESCGKVAKIFVSFVFADASLSAAAKTEVLLGVLRLLFFLLPRLGQEASSPSLDLNVLVDFLGECSKLLPLQSLPAVVRLLAEHRSLCAEAFRRKGAEDKPAAATAAAAAGAAGAAAAAAAAAESRRRMQVAGAKVIGMIKAVEERLRLSQQTHLIFELRLLLAETLTLTHAGVSNRTLQRAEAPKPRTDDETSWRDCAVEVGGKLQGDDCPYGVYRAYAQCQQFLQAPDSVLAQGSKETVAAVSSVLQVLSYLEKHHFSSSTTSNSSSSNSSSSRACPHCGYAGGRAAPPAAAAAAPAVGGPTAESVTCFSAAAAAAAAAGSSSSSSEFVRRLQQQASCLDSLELGSAAFRDCLYTPMFLREFCCRCCLALQALGSCCWQQQQQQQQVKKDEGDRQPSAAAAALCAKARSSFNSLDAKAKGALRDLHVSVARVTRLSFPSLLCSKCGFLADCFPPDSSSSSSSVQQTPLWKLLCGEELWQRWKMRSSFEGALLPLTTDVLTPFAAEPAAAAAREASAAAAAADGGKRQLDRGAEPATKLLKHCASVAVHALAHPFSAAAAAAGKAPSISGLQQQQQQEAAAASRGGEASDLTAAAAAALAAAEQPPAETAKTLQAAAAAAAAAGASPRTKRPGRRNIAAESLEDFYEWLLLWETPGGGGAAAAAASPMLQPPPISLLRQTEEWYLLQDNPPPENYLELSLTSKLQHKLLDYRFKLRQDRDPANEVAPEDASAANPFFGKRMQRLFYQFHCDRFDLLPMKATGSEALAEILDDLEEGRDPLRSPKRNSSKTRGACTPEGAAAATAAAADSIGSETSTPTIVSRAASEPATAEAGSAAAADAEASAMEVDSNQQQQQRQQQQQQPKQKA